MRRIFKCIFVWGIFSCGLLKADEGMWLLPLIEKLNMADMRELGFELTADDIYSINHTSLKDAIVSFGEGCTGEIVSADGLLFTNHHCGFDYIQDHSTLDNDYLKDGYWAASRNEELPNDDLEVRFLKVIENVTTEIFNQISDTLSTDERNRKIDEIIEGIEDTAALEGKFEAEVVPFFAGNEYYLFKYRVYTDVRLVGTPPSSIGKFGYDTDNWEWPRHTGDFSIFRVYTAPDGSPADYSPENIPLKPDYFLPVSIKGISEGDATCILGYPGVTNRYMSSYGIQEVMNAVNAPRIRIRSARQDILRKDMLTDQKINIQYASKYSTSSNYWKYSIGQNRQLAALDVVRKKQNEEASFQTWADADSVRAVEYGGILSNMREIHTNRYPCIYNLNAINESFFLAAELIGFVVNFQYLNMLFIVGDDKSTEFQNEVENLRKETENFFKDFNPETDQKVTETMFRLYAEMVPGQRQPDIYTTLQKKYKGDYEKFIDKLYTQSMFLNKERVIEFLNNPSRKMLAKDFAFQVTRSIFSKYYEEYSAYEVYEKELERLDRHYMKARLEMYPDSNFYPDANFTMRMSYGTVKTYSPGDAIQYKAFTSIEGIMEKEDTSNFEFIVPARLKELYRTRDYGKYSTNNTMPVCFLTTNDITGGNSGSPVLNVRGELVGLAFDGNWEAMSGDIEYEPEVQRCICVDIRYVLFIIDKFAGNSKLIEELKLIQ